MARTKNDDLHENILKAAKDLLVERGFASVSMQEVADRAGTTKATVYGHFESKEKLAAAVLQAVAGWAVEKLGHPDGQVETAEALIGYLARFLAIITSEYGVRLQRYALAEASRDADGLRVLYAAVNDHTVSAILGFLHERSLDEFTRNDINKLLGDATAKLRLAALFGVLLPKAGTVEHAMAAALPAAPEIIDAVESFLGRNDRNKGR
jgi:AcrR family transcriptional regulator